MANFISIKLDDETTIFLETTEISSESESSVFGNATSDKIVDRTIQKGKDYFEKILKDIRTFSECVAGSVKNISDEVEVEFSVKLKGEAGIAITSIGAEAGLTVKLKWKKA